MFEGRERERERVNERDYQYRIEASEGLVHQNYEDVYNQSINAGR